MGIAMVPEIFHKLGPLGVGAQLLERPQLFIRDDGGHDVEEIAIKLAEPFALGGLLLFLRARSFEGIRVLLRGCRLR